MPKSPTCPPGRGTRIERAVKEDTKCIMAQLKWRDCTGILDKRDPLDILNAARIVAESASPEDSMNSLLDRTLAVLTLHPPLAFPAGDGGQA